MSLQRISINAEISAKFVRVVLILSTVAYLSCSEPAWEGWGTWDGEVVSRATSPDRRVEAIIVDGSAGATSGFSSRVYLVLPGTEFNTKEDIFAVERSILTADGVDGLTVAWKDSATLEIAYKSARIFRFTSFTDSIDSEGNPSRYNIKLKEIQTK